MNTTKTQRGGARDNPSMLITIPAPIRKEAGLDFGETLAISCEANVIILRKMKVV